MAKNCCTEPTCLEYIGEGLFRYDNNCGDTKIVQTDLAAFEPTPPSTFDYNATTHSVTHNGITYQLNCGVLTYNPATCAFDYRDEKGNTVSYPVPKAGLVCNTLPDGTQVLTFSDGCGGFKQFNIPAVTMDIDSLTVAGPELTFVFGGDGNDGTVIVNICDIIAANCNATFTSINADGSWSFVDNAGNTFNYPAPPNCCTLHVQNAGTLDETAPPAQPANPPANKQDGDTLVEHYLNGVAWWTCNGGAWTYNFMHTQGDVCCTYHELGGAYNPDAPATPPKAPAVNDGDTLVLKNTPNNQGTSALSFYTCVNGAWVLDFACPIERGCCTYHSVGGAYDPATVQNTTYPKQNAAEGDTLIEKKQPNAQGVFALVFYTCVNGAWSYDYACPMRPGCCTFHDIGLPYDSEGPNVPPAPKPANAADADTLIVKYPANAQGASALGYYTCLNGVWVEDFLCPIEPGCCTYHEIGDPYNEEGPNEPPSPKAPDAAENDSLIVKYPANDAGVAALGYYTCVNGVWVEDFVCPLGAPTPPEVFIGSTQPDKADGFTVWFNPATCIVRFCDGADGWLEPRNVLCQEDEPPVEKGGADLWYKPSNCCFSILCDGTWVGVNGVNEALPVLLDCDAEEISGETRILTLQNMTDLGVCLEIPWVESADNPCLPADPPAKDGVNFITHSPFGCEFKSIAGGPWSMVMTVRDRGGMGGGNSIVVDALMVNPVQGDTAETTLCQTLVNDTCREQFFSMNVQSQIQNRGVYSDGCTRRARATTKLSVDGGPANNFYTASPVSSWAHTDIKNPMEQQGEYVSLTRMLPVRVFANSSVELCWTACITVDNIITPAANLWEVQHQLTLTGTRRLADCGGG